MPASSSWLSRVGAMVLLVFAAFFSHAQAPTPAIVIDGLGKGTVPLNGPCKFHLGDNSAWAAPTFNDSEWALIAADHPWGMQGYDRYTGYAWYRCHLSLNPAPGIAPQFSILLQRVFDADELYWNGKLIGRNGRLDPPRIWYYSQPPRIFSLGNSTSGVLAVRVWKAPLFSDDSGQDGGFAVAPLLGSPQAIANAQAALQYRWLRSRQFLFAENLIYGLIALLSFLAWLRNRTRWILFWTAAFAIGSPLSVLLLGANLPWTYVVAVGAFQPLASIQDIALWFLLLWLLPLRESPGLCRLTRILAIANLSNAILDSLILSVSWSPHWLAAAQVADGASAVVYTMLEGFPLVLVGAALLQRRRFNFARWLVAILAFLEDMIVVVHNAVKQGRQFTNWTIADRMDAPLFTIAGSAISFYTLTGALLLIALVYAVYSRLREDQRHKDALEREKTELMRTREQMRHFAEHDGLTGLWNHRIIMERLYSEVERSRREGTPLSVILADIDHFKAINDTHGHPTGDAVLREVSAIFSRGVRSYDWVGRYGGEEFLIILPGSEFEGACVRAEALRKAVDTAEIQDGESSLKVTSSFGVASGFAPGHDAEAVIRIVDAALYQAKTNGRNCVVATDMDVMATET